MILLILKYNSLYLLIFDTEYPGGEFMGALCVGGLSYD